MHEKQPVVMLATEPPGEYVVYVERDDGPRPGPAEVTVDGTAVPLDGYGRAFFDDPTDADAVRSRVGHAVDCDLEVIAFGQDVGWEYFVFVPEAHGLTDVVGRELSELAANDVVDVDDGTVGEVAETMVAERHYEWDLSPAVGDPDCHGLLVHRSTAVELRERLADRGGDSALNDRQLELVSELGVESAVGAAVFDLVDFVVTHVDADVEPGEAELPAEVAERVGETVRAAELAERWDVPVHVAVMRLNSYSPAVWQVGSEGLRYRVEEETYLAALGAAVARRWDLVDNTESIERPEGLSVVADSLGVE